LGQVGPARQYPLARGYKSRTRRGLLPPWGRSFQRTDPHDPTRIRAGLRLFAQRDPVGIPSSQNYGDLLSHAPLLARRHTSRPDSADAGPSPSTGSGHLSFPDYCCETTRPFHGQQLSRRFVASRVGSFAECEFRRRFRFNGERARSRRSSADAPPASRRSSRATGFEQSWCTPDRRPRGPIG
jgi:hypothetical protein